MKKILSWVLAFAIAFSCINMVSVSASAEISLPYDPFGESVATATAEATQDTGTTNTAKAVRVTHTAVSGTAEADFAFKAAFLSEADFGDKDSLDVTFVITNPLNKELSISFIAQEEGTYRHSLYNSNEIGADGKPTGTKLGFKSSVLVPANGIGEFEVTFPKTGYFYHSALNPKFSAENYLEKLCIRIQCGTETLEVGSTIEVAIKDNDALNEKFVNAAAGLTWMNRTTTVEKLDANTMSAVMKDLLTVTPLVTATPVVTTAPAEAKAVKVTVVTPAPVSKTAVVFKAPFLSAADFGDKDSLDVTFVLTNPTDLELSISLMAQEDGTYRDQLYNSNELGADGRPTGTKLGFKSSVLIPANGIGEFEVTFPKTGYFYHTSTSIGFASETYFEKLCIRLNCSASYVTEIPADTAFEIAIKDNDALNEKFVNAAANGNWMNGATKTEKLDANTMSEAFKNALTATPTPTPEPTPVVDKEVTNGDVENGKTNWGVWNGGTTTIVADPDNANNHVAYFLPASGNASGKYYNSVAFDLAPAILQDAEHGYNGEGAGTYKITFRARANDGYGSIFRVGINSQEHISVGAAVGSYTTTDYTWVMGTRIEMTDEWDTYTAEVKISEEYLNNVYEIYKTGLRSRIYELSFRLDGSYSYCAFRSDLFGYYVDDVKIEKISDSVVTPAPTQDPYDFVPSTAISANKSYDAYISSNGGMRYYSYVATKNRKCTIYSIGSSDTKVYLYNAAGTQLAYNDNGGTNSNFKLTYEMTAGTKYIFGIRFSSYYQTGTIPFTFEVEFRNGWTYSNGSWYYYINDVKQTNCWVTDSVGKCYLASDGKMVTGDWVYDSNGWCWIDENGYWDGVYVPSIQVDGDGFVNEIRYSISNGEVTILSVNTSLGGHVTIPAEIAGYPVTGIGAQAFYNCSKITRIEIPSTVKTVGREAFKYCDNLNSVYITDLSAWCNIDFYNSGSSWNDSNPLYYANNLYLNGELVTDLVIPEDITVIKPYAFAGCASIKIVTVHDSVTSIGKYAFYGCMGIEEMTLPFVDGAYFGYIFGASSYTFNSDYVPSSLKKVVITSATSIDGYAFYDCSGITEIIVPDSVMSIGLYAFYRCSSLRRLVIPFVGNTADGTQNTNFGYIFGTQYYSSQNNYVPYSLKEVVITNAEKIYEHAFYNCYGLESITIPESMKTIGWDAFKYCDNLNSVYITDLSAWCNIDFYNNGSSWNDANPLYNANNLYLNGELVTDLVISEGVTVIKPYAFAGCASINSVTVPDSVTSIGKYAFYGCTGLTSITVPFVGDGGNNTFFGYIFGASSYTYNNSYVPFSLEEVILTSTTRIESDAFYDCRNIESITFPSSLEYVGYSAFYHNDKLFKVNIPDIGAWCGIEFMGASANPLSFAEDLYVNGERLTELVIPEGVTKIRIYAFSGCTGLTSVTIPSSVDVIESYVFSGCTGLKTVDLAEGVEVIGGSAFSGCTGLTSVTIPSSVDVINGYAFSGCTGLKSVTFLGTPNLVRYDAFRNCDNISEVRVSDIGAWCGIEFANASANPLSFAEDLYVNGEKLYELVVPEGITEIGNCTFYNCADLVSVTIPSSVTRIGNYAFYGCESLAEVIFEADMTSVGTEAFANTAYYADGNNWDGDVFYIDDYLVRVNTSASGTVTIKDGTKVISDSAFKDCVNVTEIIIPASVTMIGDSAFYGCEGLTEINLPEGLTSIGGYAFYRCVNLTEITLPDSVISIGGYAFGECYKLITAQLPKNLTEITYRLFDNCSKLTNVELPENIQSIEREAFSNCESLTEITIPEGVTSIGNYSFFKCVSLTEINIPASVTILGEEAFFNCAGLTKVTFHNGIERIGDFAFKNCVNLTEISIPDRVTYIGIEAFRGCTGLKKAVVSGSVTEITYRAFEGCVALTEIELPEKLQTINQDAFVNCESLTEIIVPSSVTLIREGAFRGCNGLTKITLPFVGSDVNVTEGSSFGFIFGARYGYQNYDYVPASLKEVVITGDTTIGREALYNCGGITKITFTGNATEVGDHIFAYCENLTEVVLPQNVTELQYGTFYGCKRLNNITLPESLQKIELNAFDGCESLTEINVPSSVTEIGRDAFYNCSSLTAVHITDMSAWCRIKFDIPSIFSNPLSHAKNLYLNGALVTKLVIPDEVEAIGNNVFAGCSSLASVTIPDSVKSIGENAFAGCGRLTEVTIPQSVTSIGENAFANCGSLTEITIPDSVKSIGEGAFLDCDRLTKVTLPFVGNTLDGEENTHFGYIFGALVSKDNSMYVPTSLKEVIITNAVRIGDRAFCYCDNIIEITIPDSVTSIGFNSFYGCNSLTKITIPFVGNTPDGTKNTHFGYIFGASDSFSNYSQVPTSLKEIVITNATTIDTDAFSNCSSITEIKLLDSVMNIGDWAFSNCSELAVITIPASVMSIGDYAFSKCDSLRSVYYVGSEAQWQAITIGSDNLCLTNATRYYLSDGWHEVDGKKYYIKDKEVLKSQWIGEYYVDADGYAKTNAWVEEKYLGEDGKLVRSQWVGDYYVDENGNMLKNTWHGDYYFGSDGKYLRRIWKDDKYLGADGKVTKLEWVDGYYLDANGNKLKNAWQDGKYLDENGKITKLQWVGESYLDENGNMLKNAWQDGKYLDENGKVTKSAWVDGFYLDENGNKLKNTWQDGKYLDENGKITKLQWVDEYYLDVNGNKVTNAWVGDKYLSADGKITKSQWVGEYYVNENGNKVTNAWVGDKYLGADGTMLKNTWKDGKYLGSDGKIVKSQWVGEYYVDERGNKVTNAWVGDKYLGADGKVTTPPVSDGWVEENGNWVYYENGVKLTNTWKEDSVGWCYLTADGTMATNEWIQDSAGWCYVGANGYCLTDCWMQDSVGWCYLNSEGRMATNTWILDSVGWCYVGSDGYCVTDCWMADSVGWVYLDSEGRMKTNAWVMDSVGWCYVGSDGYAMTNCWMADSVGWCYLDAEGRMVVNGWVQDSNGWCWLDESGYWNGEYR